VRTAFLQLDHGGILDHVLADVPATGARWDDDPAPLVRLRSADGGTILDTTLAACGARTSTAGTVAAATKLLQLVTDMGFVRWEDVVIGPNAAGQWEWATVDGISAATAATWMTVLDDLSYAYGDACPVKSHRLAIQVGEDDCGSIERRGIAEWTYAIAEVPRQDSTLFAISRYAPRLSLTAQELLQEDPRVRRLVASTQRLDLMIRRIWERHVLPAIGRMWFPGALVAGEAAEEALVWKIRSKLALDAKDYQAAEKYVEYYNSELSALRNSLIDLNESGVPDEEIRGVANPRIMRG